MMGWRKTQTDGAQSIFDGAYENFPDGPECYRGQTLDETLGSLFHSAVAHANSRITWYGRSAKIKAATAKRLRKWSLILFAVGTIAPISVAFLMQIRETYGKSTGSSEGGTFEYITHLPMAEIGYLLLALAGALIIFDQFFDSSGSWIRFRQSEARLQVLLAEFRFAWAGLMAKYAGNVAGPAQVNEFTTLARDFVTKVELLAEEETTAWAQRFSERLSSFDRKPNLKVTVGGERPAGAAGTAAPNGSSRAGAALNGGTAPPAPEAAQPPHPGPNANGT